MSENQTQQNTTENNTETFYDNVLQNKTAIDSMYYVQKDLLGQDIPYDPKTILDSFLTHKRYFEANILSTANTAIKVLDENTPEDLKRMYAYSSKIVEDMPNFGEGAPPLLEATGDYLAAGVTDPTNLLSGLAAAFTFGAGAAPGLAAKEAAKMGVTEVLKSKLRSGLSKGAIKSYAAEGSVAGLGGAGQEVIKQNVEKDVGLRKNISPEEIALQGVAEGVLSPVLGVLGSEAGKGLLKGTAAIGKGTYNLAGKVSKATLDKDLPSLENAAALIKRNFLPTAGLGDVERRIIERTSGEVSSLKERAEKLTDELNEVISKTEGFDSTDPNTVLMLNRVLEGDANSLAAVSKINPEIARIYNDFDSLRAEATEYGLRSALNPKTKGIFKLNNEANYLKNVPEAFSVSKRLESFDQFIKKNPDIIDDLTKLIRSDPTNVRWQKFTEKYIDSNNKIIVSAAKEKELVTEIAKNLYSPTRRFRKETGGFEKRLTEEKLPDTLKKILGYNNRPAHRMAETINAIVDTASRANVARDIASFAIKKGLATEAPDKATAISKLGTDDVISLAGSFNKGQKKSEIEETITRLPYERIDKSLKNIYVTKDYGLQLKEMFEDSGFFNPDNPVFSSMLDTIRRTQAFAKAGKTIYSPIALARNVYGAIGYTAASGNIKGIYDILKLSKADRQKLISEFETLGLKGSSIDLNQSLRRFGDISDRISDAEGFDKFIVTGGLSLLGKRGEKIAKAARYGYGATDDIAKMAVYAGEKNKAEKIFNSFSPEIQKEKLKQFVNEYNIASSPWDGLATKEKYIAEQAAKNTANVTPMYGRIPAILEKARAVPIVGTFTAYPAERLRNTFNILKLSTDELKEGFDTGNKELQKTGMARLAQWFATQNAVYTGAYLGTELAGQSEYLDEMRDALPDWSKNAALFVFDTDKDGNGKYVNLSYLNPDQYIIEGIMPLILKSSRGEDVTEDLDKTLVRAAGKFFEPYVGMSMSVEAGANLLDFIKNPNNESALLKTVKLLEPGYIRMGRDMVKSAGALDDTVLGTELRQAMYPQPFGLDVKEPEGPFDYLARNGFFPPGLKTEVFNPQRSMGFALNTINRNIESNKNDFTRELTNLLADPKSRYNQIDMLNKYKEVLEDNFIAQKESKKIFDSIGSLVGKNKLFKILDDVYTRGGLFPKSKSARSNIINYGKSSVSGLSDNIDTWRNINKSLLETTGQNYYNEIQQLRQNMYRLERFYDNRDLAKETPKIKIGE